MTSWFVVNAREASWWSWDGLGVYCPFEEKAEKFPQLGINLNVLEPGESLGMYHREEAQEDFLVLAGECVLLVEGEERPLRRWDFFHCPPSTEHMIVGVGDRPCLVLALGARPSGAVRYPVSEVALRYGAGVKIATDSPAEAYADRARPERCPPPELP